MANSNTQRRRLRPGEDRAYKQMRALQVERGVKDMDFIVIPSDSPEYNVVKQYRGLKDKAEAYDVDSKDVPHAWLKFDKDASLFIKNPEYVKPEDRNPADEIDFTSIFKEVVKPVKINIQVSAEFDGVFDRLVYTDTHIGMEPNPEGNSLYGGKWNEYEATQRLEFVVSHTLKYQNSRILYIDDLGDFVDGQNEETTRGGHRLKQNMTNQEMYDFGILWKVRKVESLLPYYDKIIIHNVNDDNHSGDFSYYINQAFKSYIELKYPGRVEVTNFKKFMDHYIVKTPGKFNYGFILSHGKDKAEKKHGMDPKLKPKDQQSIDDYIDANFLSQENLLLEFSKGDSHQQLFDETSASRFNYFNYWAASPSSNYIQTNFKKGKSGIWLFNYEKDRRRPTYNPLEFEWK